MVGGTIIVSACLLVLGWTSEIVGIFVTDKETVQYPTLGFGIWYGAHGLQKRSATISIAVLSIYAVDFAINAGEATMPSGSSVLTNVK